MPTGTLFAPGACNCGSSITACGCTGVPATLTYTHSVLGSCTITYNPVASNWTGTINYAYPGLNGCAPQSLVINITFTVSTCDATINWHVTSGSNCPTPTGNSTIFNSIINCSATLLSRNIVCSPFSVVWSFSGALTGTCPDLWGTAAFTETVS